jgi:UDP:flavonoid glycosyltransferase YjiC (YdhE family)
MRVLFSTQVGAGHWRPLAPFAKALEAAGHEVAFATTPFGCSVIAEHGFRCFPAGIDDWRIPSPQGHRGKPKSSEPPQAAEVWTEVFVNVQAAHAIPDLLAICAQWQPDLIVREATEFGGYVVAERLGLPHATVQVGAHRPDLEQSIAMPLNHQRAAVGLPHDPGLATLHRYLLLSPVPPSFQDPGRPLPPTAFAVRWIPFDREHPSEEALPEWAGRLPDRPTVYATLGTAYNRTPGVFAAILEGMCDEPVNLIVTLGPNLDPADYGSQPPHIHIVRYIPQSLILRQSDLVIAHGGFGTVMTALASGLPLVLIPIAADMPENARRCAAMGLGQVINSHERTPGAIRAAVRTVLHSTAYRQNAERVQAEMRALPEPSDAVLLLERLAADKKPILADRQHLSS